MKRKLHDEVIGWCGTCAIVIAYILVSFNMLSVSTLLYQLLNGAGALGLAYISFKDKAYQPEVLNIVWASIALISIIRIII